MLVKLPASGVTHHYFLSPSRPFLWHWQVPGAEPASQKLPILCGDELLNSSNKLLGINIISLKFWPPLVRAIPKEVAWVLPQTQSHHPSP